MARNFTPVGSEIQVNAVTNFSEQDADIAVATDGRFLVAYEQAINGDADIRLRFVEADGTAGSDVLVETSMGIQRDPAVAPRANGAATVVWRNSASGDVQYAIVSGVAGPTQDLIAGAAFTPDIAALADGRALVVARKSTPPPTSSSGSSMPMGWRRAPRTSSTMAPATRICRRSRLISAPRWSSTRTPPPAART